MRKLIIISFLLILTLGCSVQKNGVIGVWSVTTYSDRGKTDVNWEFKSEQIFNLHERNSYDTNFRANENGTWNIEKKKLTITLTGEMIHGKRVLFTKPQIIRFLISKEDPDIILTPVDENWEKIKEAVNLRLIKKS